MKDNTKLRNVKRSVCILHVVILRFLSECKKNTLKSKKYLILLVVIIRNVLYLTYEFETR